MIRRPPRSTRTDTTLSLHDALPIWPRRLRAAEVRAGAQRVLHLRSGSCRRPSPQGHRHRAARATEADRRDRSEEHTSELQSLMRISYAVFCLKKKNTHTYNINKRIYNDNYNRKHSDKQNNTQ